MMQTHDALYARTESGLMVPRAAVDPVAAPPAQPQIPKRMLRKFMEQQGRNFRCPGVPPRECGKIVSQGRICKACADERELNDRMAAAGLVAPSGNGMVTA